QRERIGRDQRHLALVVDEGARVEGLRVHDGGIDVGEDLELVRDADVVAVGGQPEGNPALADLAVLEGLDHALLQGLPPDPAVTLDHAYTLVGSYCLLGRRGKSREAAPTSRGRRSAPPGRGWPAARCRSRRPAAPPPAAPRAPRGSSSRSRGPARPTRSRAAPAGSPR